MDNSINNFDINFLDVKIEKIIPPDKDTKNAIYILSVKDSFGKQWNKKVTLNDLDNLREYISYNVPIAESLPFPTYSILSYLPIIGRRYTEYNWDVLIEFKFVLDNFFSIICKNNEVYKLSQFEKFFEEERRTERLSTSFSFIRC